MFFKSNRSCRRHTLNSLQILETLCRLFQNDMCVLVVITSHTGELTTVDRDFLSSNHAVSRHGAAEFGLLAVVVGYLRRRIGYENGRSIAHGRGGFADSCGGRLVVWAISSIAGVVRGKIRFRGNWRSRARQLVGQTGARIKIKI